MFWIHIPLSLPPVSPHATLFEKPDQPSFSRVRPFFVGPSDHKPALRIVYFGYVVDYSIPTIDIACIMIGSQFCTSHRWLVTPSISDAIFSEMLKGINVNTLLLTAIMFRNNY